MPRVHVGAPLHSGALTLFPLWTEEPEAPAGYVTGPEAEGSHLLSVAELEHAQVPQLLVTNAGSAPLLLLEGETLAGGLQTRVLNVSLLVPAGVPLPVPVACVEAGRWGDRRATRRGASHAPIGLRSRKTASVNAARPHGGRDADQSAVWEDVAAYSHRLDAPSATQSYLDVVAQRQVAADEVKQSLRPLPGQRGVVVGIAGEVRALELFDCTATFAAYFDSLLDGYAIEALAATPAATSATAARRFVRRVAKARWTWSDAVGAGRELAVEDPDGLAGTGVGWADERPPVHLAVFA